MRTLLLLTLGGLLCCGCGPGPGRTRPLTIEDYETPPQSAMRIYQIDAESAKAYNKGFKDGLAYPAQGEK